LLLRADSGFCSQHLIAQTLRSAAELGRQVDLLIKCVDADRKLTHLQR
jgi:hypothetical protein